MNFYVIISPVVYRDDGTFEPLTREHRITIPDCANADEAMERLTSKLDDLCDPWRNGPVSE